MTSHYSISRGLIDKLWLHAKDSMNVYRSMDGRSYRQFKMFMLASDVVLEFSFGALRVEGLFQDQGKVHGIFWSSDTFRNIQSMRGALKRLGKMFGTRELFCEFPRGTRSIQRLLEKGGFVRYGGGTFELTGESVPTDIYVLQLW